MKMKTKNAESRSIRTGRWAPDEKILFLYGLRLFGKGRWKKMSCFLPHRSLVQIKSHAQKVLKRQQAGENIFHRLEESYDKIDYLVVQAARRRDSFRVGGRSFTIDSNDIQVPNIAACETNNIEISPSVQVTFSSSTSFHGYEQIGYESNIATGVKQNMIQSQLSDGSVLAAATLCQLRVTR